MIVSKTKLKKIPETCKGCKFSEVVDNLYGLNSGRVCSITGILCPIEKSPHGNAKYGKSKYCPLVEIEINESNNDEIKKMEEVIDWVTNKLQVERRENDG